MTGTGAPMTTLFARIRPDLGSFKGELAAKIKPALSEAQQAIAATARANIAQTQKEIAANRELAASYLSIGKAARAGSQEAIIAGRLASEATRRASAQLATTRGAAARGAARNVIGGGGARAAAALGGTTAAVYALYRGLKAVVVGGADFETSLNVFQASSKATAAEMRAVSAESKRLGADITLPNVSAGDAAEAMRELSKGGLSVEKSLTGARGTLQLAAAGMLDTSMAAGIVAQQLNVFGLAGDQATHVADLLANAANSAQGEVSDMAIALQQAAAVARLAGLGVDETVTSIALLAKNGLIGSDAGTSLRTMLLRLVPSAKIARDQVAALRVELQDSNGSLLPLPQILENYRNALDQLTPVQRQQALTTIFGADAIRAASILTREGAAGFETMAGSVSKAGGAQAFAEARTKGLAGSFGALKSNVETIAITWAQELNPVIKRYLDRLNEGDGLQRRANATLETTKNIISDAAAVWNTVIPPIRLATDAVGGVGDAVKIMIAAWVAWKATAVIAKIASVVVELKTMRLALLNIRTVQVIAITATFVGAKKVADEIKDLQTKVIEAQTRVAAPGSKVRRVLIPDLADEINELKAAGVTGRDILAKMRERLGTSANADSIIADAFVFSRGSGVQVERLGREFKRKLGAEAASGAQWFTKELVEGLATAAAAPAAKAPKIPKAIQDSIDMARRGIDDLKVSLKETIEQNARDLTDSIEQAKGNLIQIGGSLAASISAAIDQPFVDAGQKIQAAQNRLALEFDTKNAALEAEARRLQRLQSRLTLRTDKRAVENLRDQVILPGGGGLSEDPKKALAQLETLAAKHTSTRASVEAFIEKYRAALLTVRSDKLGAKQEELSGRRAAAEAPLNLRGERLQVAQDAADERKREITTKIGDLTTELAGGQIKIGEFNKRIAKLLAADGVTYKRAGALLGTSFREGFESQVTGLLKQARAVSDAPRRPGTGQEPKIIQPLATLEKNAAATARIAREIGDKTVALQTRIAKATEAAAKAAKGNPRIVQLPPSPSKKLPGKQAVISEALAGTTG